MSMKVKDAIEYLEKNSKKRNFKQAIELIVNVKGIDLKIPENRFNEEIQLPSPLSKPKRVGVIGNVLASKAEKADLKITEKELDELAKDKRKFKKLIKNVDYLIAEAPLMMKIGKEFGKILGPKGKMPKPLPPNADPNPLIERLKNVVVVRLRESPVIQTIAGYEDMSPEDIEKNVNTIISAILKHLPQGRQNIRSVYLKKTMSPPVEIEV